MGERRPFVALGSDDVMPDGMAVDAEGGIWVAVWGGGVIQRYDADGQLTGVVRVPAANVTSCAFGGPDLRHPLHHDGSGTRPIGWRAVYLRVPVFAACPTFSFGG